MNFFKSLIPDFILKALRPFYHGLLAWLANIYFGEPSKSMVVIGVTGTAGKSTTAAMLAHILNYAGKKCGFITTVSFSTGSQEFLNKHGLSMPGGWLLNKQLKQMLDAGCKYAVIECTSEGLAQNRHVGINFDAAVLTNLSHAHVEAHGSFGNYQASKGKLFSALGQSEVKDFFPEKVLGANFDDPMAGYFLSFKATKKFGVSFKGVLHSGTQKVFQAKSLKTDSAMEFEIEGASFSLEVLGEFNVKNAALAAATANMLGVELDVAAQALDTFYGVLGRMQSVENNLGLTVIVDYGCEPESIKAALESAAQLPHKRLIHVFGSTGGHRDVSKRFVFGKTSAQFADEIILTNDDVYDSDPEKIAVDIKQGISSFKLRKPQVETILDRRSAIAKALASAEKGDLVLITGKGSEQFLVLPGNERIEWDEVGVVKEEMGKLTHNL